MTIRLPPPPPEVPVDADLSKCAPRFADKVWTLLHEHARRGHDPIVFEAFRSQARQDYLFGFGREYDDPGDPRGIVTFVHDGWHLYGLAVDIISKKDGWAPAPRFYADLSEIAQELSLTSGEDWHKKDEPHAQWWIPGMHVSPSDHARELRASGGVHGVWRELRAL